MFNKKKKILWDVDYEDDRKTDSGTVYKQIVITAKLQIGKSGQKKKRAGWEKSFKVAKVRIGL